MAVPPCPPEGVLDRYNKRRDLLDSSMRWEAIQGASIAVTAFFGIPLLRTRTPDETVRTIRGIGKNIADRIRWAVEEPRGSYDNREVRRY
jgi:ERCC4-type nuclease